MTMREGERESHGERQTYLVVSRCLSLWKMSCLYLFPSARLLCPQRLSLCLSHSFTLNLTFSKIFTEGKTEDNTTFHINPLWLVRLLPVGKHFVFHPLFQRWCLNLKALFLSNHLHELFYCIYFCFLCTDRTNISFSNITECAWMCPSTVYQLFIS